MNEKEKNSIKKNLKRFKEEEFIYFIFKLEFIISR